MRRRDLPVSELNTGTVRQCSSRWGKSSLELQIIAKEDALELRIVAKEDAPFCADCGKRAFKTEVAARQVIGQQIKRGRLREEGSFAVHPYMCKHGWWHFGRDRKTLERFKELQKTKTGIQPTTN